MAEEEQAPAEVDAAHEQNLDTSVFSQTAADFGGSGLGAIPEATQQLGSTMSLSSPARLGAYFCRRSRPQSYSKPAASEVHTLRKPAVAAQLLPVHGMQHQVLACRGNPQPTEGSQLRWPDKLAGGGPHPLDDRRHSNWFGYRQLRWKKPFVPDQGQSAEVPQLGLEDCVLLLTMKFGTLKAAVDKMDFFRDGKLTCTEWQEGIHQLITAGTKPEFLKFKSLLEPRKAFDERARKLFKLVDKDRDGLISYDDIANAKWEPSESSREITRRRSEESFSAIEADIQFAARSPPQKPKELAPLDATLDPMDFTMLPTPASKKEMKAHFGEGLYNDMRTFAALLISRFDDIDKAYSFFDVNNNGTIGMTEFAAGAKQLRFAGNLKAVFKELDVDGTGRLSRQHFKTLRALDVSEADAMKARTNREKVIERKLRSPIARPGKHERGLCLASTHISFPEGERVATSAGFHSFARSTTGRLDSLLHPDELPGVDAENFTKEHGPGFVAKGIEHFPEVMSDAHPLRGNKFKVGSTVNRTERFGPYIPSAEGRKDLEHSAATFATYEGQKPRDQWKVNGTGAHPMVSKRDRMGPTLGSSDSFGLIKPQPLGPWGDSRMTLRLKSQSVTSLKQRDC